MQTRPVMRAHQPVALRSPPGRWTLVAAVAASGTAFIEGTIVNVSLPAIARDFGIGVAGLQWILDAYLLALSALMLLGGALGDIFPRRRVLAISLGAFAATSLACAVASSVAMLVVFRVLQGAAGAVMIPNSLALVETTIIDTDRGTAIGRWAGWSAVTTAIGPLLGGWIVDTGSWRWVFAIMAPLALAAAWVAGHLVPAVSTASRQAPPRMSWRDLDLLGATCATLGLTSIVAGLLVRASGPLLITALGVGVAFLAAFVLVERRATRRILPLEMFRSRDFTWLNVATFFIYAALSGILFLLMVELQSVLGYSALAAGASLLPVNALLLVLSPVAGRLAQRSGARLPIVIGSLIAAAGTILFVRVRPGATYATTVLPAVALFGLGLASLVAPLTAAVLAAVPTEAAGIASAVNNAVARLAGLIAVAAIPLGAGLPAGQQQLGGDAFVAGFTRAMWICAGLCVIGALGASAGAGGGTRVASSEWRVASDYHPDERSKEGSTRT